jgi:hypothetical protein
MRRATLEKALRYAALAAVLLLSGRAGAAIFREPCIGVADNLDYWRVAEPAGIRVEPMPRQGSTMTCSYELTEPSLKSSLTSPSLVAWLARSRRWGIGGPSDRFDLRRLGVLYWLASTAILIAAFAAGVSAVYVLLSAWVLYDPGFFLFFNSLYADPALILGLTSAMLLLLQDPLAKPASIRARPARTMVLVLLILAAAFAGFSKMQYSFFPSVLLACCGLAIAIRRKLPDLAEGVFLSVLLALAVAAPIHFLRGPAPRFLDANNYNAVFGGIARVSSDPAAALGALGIPEEHRLRPAKDFFAAAVDAGDPVMPHVREISRLRLAALYLADGAALIKTARAVHGDLARVRTHPRGTFTKAETGRRPHVYRSPEQFSLWRARALNRLWLWSLLLLGGVALFLGARALRGAWGTADAAILFLLLWVTSQSAIAVLGEGFVNLHQHLLGARLGLDLLIALVLGRIGLLVASATGNKKRAPGEETEREGLHL